ncbi:MAG: BamA/TamA family outer membrane protein [Bacteroidaceae bacterium]|nr:BamA/TamA family outer membrane protein [Bacteroidaceae bacterium]
MKKIHSLLLATALLFLSACSTTENLPEGEILYTGIWKISYTDKEQTVKKQKRDTAGVIVAVADAAEQVGNVLKGDVKSLSDLLETQDTIVKSKKRKAAEKQLDKTEAQALLTATEEVNAVLEYAPNNSLFGSSYYRFPLPVGLWAYNKYVNKEGGLSKWMYKSFSTEPVLLSSVNPDTRVKVATNTLHNYGYFQGKVKYELDISPRNDRKAKINYYVRPGRVYRLDSIAYAGFSAVQDSIIQANRRTSVLRKGDAFNVVKLTEEQTRLEKLLRNEGYYYYKAGNSTYKADTVARLYYVQLQMSPKNNLPPRLQRRLYMGATHISMFRYDGELLDTTRTIRTTHFNFGGRKMPLRPIAWFRNIAHRHGQLYRQDDQERTQELLSSMGVFSQYNVNYMMRDTTAGCDTLDLYITATLDKPWTTDLEMNVTEKNSDRIGPGLSLSLQRKNTFRDAELLNWKIYGNYEWRTHNEHTASKTFFNSYEVGTQLSLDFPHIVFPGIGRRTFRFPTATSFSVSADWLNRAQYFNLFSMGLKVTYSWHKNATSRHELTPFSLTYDKLIHSTHEFDSIMQANPALSVSMRDRFVPAMQYTYTFQSASHHRNPLWWQFSIKEAGNVTSAIYALGGESFSKENKNLFRNPFAQYVKVTSELHNNFRITRQRKVVTRLSAGIIYSYGNSKVAPYSDQFFVGGANSIRAYTIRTVGPGRYYTPRSKYSYLDQTGDFKLEANAEYRFALFGGLNGALFVDAGNVWLLRKDENRPGGRFSLRHFARDIALGTGAGLRYDMDFLVLRLDLGVALHDPADNHRSGYYNIGKFKDGLALHFAIGYPF